MNSTPFGGDPSLSGPRLCMFERRAEVAREKISVHPPETKNRPSDMWPAHNAETMLFHLIILT